MLRIDCISYFWVKSKYFDNVLQFFVQNRAILKRYITYYYHTIDP